MDEKSDLFDKPTVLRKRQIKNLDEKVAKGLYIKCPDCVNVYVSNTACGLANHR